MMVNVEDVNDVVPVFETDYYNLDVPCDEDIGTTVVTVAASDDDSSKCNYSTSIGLDKVVEWAIGYEATTGKRNQPAKYASSTPKPIQSCKCKTSESRVQLLLRHNSGMCREDK